MAQTAARAAAAESATNKYYREMVNNNKKNRDKKQKYLSRCFIFLCHRLILVSPIPSIKENLVSIKND